MAPVLIAIMMLLIVHTSYKRMCGYQIAIVLAIPVLYFVLSCVAMAVTWSGTVDGCVSGMQSRLFDTGFTVICFVVSGFNWL